MRTKRERRNCRMVRKEETLEERVIELILGFVLSGREFFFRFYSKIRIFVF